MKISNNHIPNLRTVIGSLIIAIVVFIGIVCFFFYKYGLSDFLGAMKLYESPNFGVSFMASAIEDVLFFSILGLTVFFLALRKPEKESLETRVWYLFSGENATVEARDYVRHAINKLACISPHTKITLNIDSFDQSINAFKVYASWELNLANMYDNQEYYDNEISSEIFLDDINVPDGINGQALSMKTVYSDKTCTHINGPINIDNENLKYKQVFEMKLSPNGSCTHLFDSWQYNQVDGEYILSPIRYTEKFEVILRNTSGRSITYRESDGHAIPRQELVNGDEVVIYNDRAKPSNNIVVYLHLSEANNPAN